MKKITFIIIGMLAAAAAYAQAPKDSTVNIIAYWNAGETYAYAYSAEQYTIVNGDTTEVSYTNSIQIYEILEETENSYKISVTYKDEHSSDPLNNTLNALLEERYGDPYILDFYCPRLKICIELDGDHHYSRQGYEHDLTRNTYLSHEHGITILRYENKDVFKFPEMICAEITNLVKEKLEGLK